jgi:hypothetical protein
MKDSWPTSEKELCAVVIDHFQAEGWTVFQEVSMGGQGGLDILCRRGPVLYAIECKRQFTDHLIEQALHWRRYANFVSVAVPNHAPLFKARVCSLFGLGVLMVSRWEGYRKNYFNVAEQAFPALRRKVLPDLREHVERFHQEGLCEAGTAAGSRSTPFHTTVERLRAVVEKSGADGISLYDAVNSIDHHWRRQSTGYASVKKYILTGVIQGLRLEGEGKEARLYAKTAEVAA